MSALGFLVQHQGWGRNLQLKPTVSLAVTVTHKDLGELLNGQMVLGTQNLGVLFLQK